MFRAITPYKKWWTAQATVAVAEDEELLRLAAESGCKAFFLGLESFSQSDQRIARKHEYPAFTSFEPRRSGRHRHSGTLGLTRDPGLARVSRRSQAQVRLT